jgi:hypothetical protein
LGAAGVLCGGGRRHGGRLGLGCIAQRVRVLEVLVAFVSFLSLWLLVSFSGRGVILAPFLPFHPCVASHAVICSGCFPVSLFVAVLDAAGVVCGDVSRCFTIAGVSFLLLGNFARLNALARAGQYKYFKIISAMYLV